MSFSKGSLPRATNSSSRLYAHMIEYAFDKPLLEVRQLGFAQFTLTHDDVELAPLGFGTAVHRAMLDRCNGIEVLRVITLQTTNALRGKLSRQERIFAVRLRPTSPMPSRSIAGATSFIRCAFSSNVRRCMMPMAQASNPTTSFRNAGTPLRVCRAPAVDGVGVTDTAIAVTRKRVIVLLRRKEGALDPFGDT